LPDVLYLEVHDLESRPKEWGCIVDSLRLHYPSTGNKQRSLITYVKGIVIKGFFESKLTEARVKLLLHFILCSAAQLYSIKPLVQALQSLKSKLGIDEQFWALLPSFGPRETLQAYMSKLEDVL
jgi:hypothetical protein